MNERVRVAAVFSTPTGDLSLFRFLSEREELDLTVLFTHPDWSGRGEAGEAKFDHRVLAGRTLRQNPQLAVDQVWNPGLIRDLDRMAPDVLFVGGYGTISTARAIGWAARARVPWVLYSESWGTRRGSPAKRWLKRLALRLVLGRASGFVTYGRRGEEYLRHFGARSEIIAVGSNRDLVSIAKAVDEIRARPASREPAFLFIGRLVEAKGVDVLLRAFELAAPKVPEWRLKVAGDGPMRPALERATARLPVDFLGSVPFSQIADALASADLLVLPSRQDAWGQVVPEAMAAGLPVLSSDAVGAAEYFVEPERTGWLVPPGDAPALAAAMREAARADLVAMGSAARARAMPEDVRQAARRVGDLLLRARRNVWR